MKLVYLCVPKLKILKKNYMLIIPIKEGENIERALKKYKKKFEKTNVMKQLRARKEFEKPSISRRQLVIRAAYKQRMQSAEI